MLTRIMAGKLDGSWCILWTYAHFKHDAAALLPVASRAYNIGLDGSGTHSRTVPFSQSPLTAGNSDYRFPDRVEFDPHLVAEIRRVCHQPLARRLARDLFDNLGLK